MKGYKVFLPDFTSNEGKMQYAENQTFEVSLPIKICNKGLHFCTKAQHCFNHYAFDSNNIVCEVEALGEVQTHSEDSKVCTNILKVGRRLNWQEVLIVANDGINNTGHSNSGDRNSGDQNSGYRNSGNWNSGDQNSGDQNSGYRNSGNRNSGDQNSGDRNSGYRNSGNRNSGNWNSGNWNSGDQNSGYRNSGDQNSGYRNSGDRNSGNWNSGDRNSGDQNSGYRNSGDWNSGNWNSGDQNSGNRNSGYRNSGDRNSGNWNSGDRNSGDQNSGYRNSGAFCLDNDPKLYLFDKITKMTVRQWEQSKAVDIMNRLLETTMWIYSGSMTQEEKQMYSKYETTDGYLKTKTLKEAWADMWGNLSQENKKVFTDLENFDADKFFEITGIRV